MLLDSLYQTVEKLQERIKSHQDKLSQSEALTRNTLVDPLLRALEWDTEDPMQVMPEFKLKMAVGNKGSADYALMWDDKPAIVIEAKKLGTDLSTAVVGQGINYCSMNGFPYLVCTNGRNWDVYSLLRPGNITEKKVISFDISDLPANVCLDALVLWRRSVQNDKVVQKNGEVRKAQTPVIEPDAAPDTPPVQPLAAPPAPEIAPPAPTITHPVVGGNWISLSQLQPKKGDTKPLEICFPDGSTNAIKSWINIPCEAVGWLIQNGRLNENGVPVQRGQRYILARQPVHPTGTEFKNSKHIGSFYVERHYDALYSVKNACMVIEKAGTGVAPSQFSVLLP